MATVIPAWLRRLAAPGLLLLLLLAPGVAARPINVSSFCHASLGQRTAWHCDDADWTIAGAGILLRFHLFPPGLAAVPRSLVTVAARFERIDVRVFDDNGHQRDLQFGPSDARRIVAGPMMVLPLPHISAHTRMVEVRILKPWTKAIGSDAVLDSDPDGSGWSLDVTVGMAIICGLLIVPLLLNAAFYSVLPERFVLLHLVLTASMLVQVLLGSGFVNLIFPLDQAIESPILNVCYAVMASAALGFAADFIEPGMISRRLRRHLVLVARLTLAVGLAMALPLDAIRPFAALVLHLDMVPAMVLVSGSALVARRRGSVAALYLLVAWGPTIMIGFWKVGQYVLPGQRPTGEILVYQLGLAVQVLVNTLAIISRFVVLRQERDNATALARELEGVAARDPLTGLRNRHAIEGRFSDLFDDGFRTMAAIDLDHFKQVNDRHGHAVGDHVLRAAAAALGEDADTRAIRMGGEEFLLLLRGPDATERADRYRRAISTRIAIDVPGLDRVVTASMGLVEHDPGGQLRIEFEALYARCDHLLYEAKRLGRNRTMRERVTSFIPPRQSRAQS